MKNLLYFIVFVVGMPFVFAQQGPMQFKMESEKWEVPQDAVFERFENRETLLITKGRATLKNFNFVDGIIEVDVYANSKRSFAGITFRKKEDHMDEVYMRMHKSNQVDAIQYTPIFNNESNWQLYKEHQAKVIFKDKGWNRLRIEVIHHTAKVFVNDKIVMEVDNLRTGNSEGAIGLWALFTNRFSNFTVTPKTYNEEPQAEQKITKDGIISRWQISNAKRFDNNPLNASNFPKLNYIEALTESSGLLPISKYVKKTLAGNFEQNVEDYTVAYTDIYATENKTIQFSFDYSDKILVYFNETLLFKGNNAFRAKGIQHTGHVDLESNKLVLHLQPGRNRLYCVVVEKANGWGLIGKLEN